MSKNIALTEQFYNEFRKNPQKTLQQYGITGEDAKKMLSISPNLSFGEFKEQVRKSGGMMMGGMMGDMMMGGKGNMQK